MTMYTVSTNDLPEPYEKRWAAFDQAVADFLRLYFEAEAEDIELRVSS